MFKLDLEKAEEPEVKLPKSFGLSKKQENSRKTSSIIEKSRGFQKNIFSFIDYAKAFDCVDHNKLWEILKEMGIPDQLLPSEKSVFRSRSNNWNWTWNNGLVSDWEGVCQGCILSPYLFNICRIHHVKCWTE